MLRINGIVTLLSGRRLRQVMRKKGMIINNIFNFIDIDARTLLVSEIDNIKDSDVDY